MSRIACQDVVVLSTGNLRAGKGEALRSVRLIVTVHPDEALQLTILGVWLVLMVAHPKLREVVEQDDIFLLVIQRGGWSRSNVIQSSIFSRIFTTGERINSNPLQVLNVVVVLLGFIIFSRSEITILQSIKLVVDRCTSRNIQMHAAQAMDGIHIGRSSFTTNGKCTGIGEIHDLVHLNHRINLRGAVRRVNVVKTCQIDVDIVEQQVLATLDGGQRTGGLSELITMTIIFRVTMTILSHQDIVSRQTSLAVGTTTEHTTSDIHGIA